jgi:hypothetical protein
MGSVHARGDTFLTFGLKALTETNTSRLATGLNQWPTSVNILSVSDYDNTSKWILLLSLPWWWRQYTPLKHRSTSMRQHSTISQRAVMVRHLNTCRSENLISHNVIKINTTVILTYWFENVACSVCTSNFHPEYVINQRFNLNYACLLPKFFVR